MGWASPALLPAFMAQSLAIYSVDEEVEAETLCVYAQTRTI